MSYRDFCDRFMTALSKGDFETQGEMLHEDFIVTEAEGLPYSGSFRGLEGWCELSRAVIKTWAGFRIRPIEFPGEGPDTFLVRFAISGRSRKTDKPFETTVLEMWRFKDGKLAEILPYYFDTHALALADQA